MLMVHKKDNMINHRTLICSLKNNKTTCHFFICFFFFFLIFYLENLCMLECVLKAFSFHFVSFCLFTCDSSLFLLLFKFFLI